MAITRRVNECDRDFALRNITGPSRCRRVGAISAQWGDLGTRGRGTMPSRSSRYVCAIRAIPNTKGWAATKARRDEGEKTLRQVRRFSMDSPIPAWRNEDPAGGG